MAVLVAGIDEAGYGPLLGPLVVGGAAFVLETNAHAAQGTTDVSTPATPPQETPDLWRRLSRIVSAKADKTGRRLHVADSKVVYGSGGGAGGLKALEKSVLAFAATTAERPNAADGPTSAPPLGRLHDLLAVVDPGCGDLLARHPWYAAEPDEAFPLACSAAGLGPMVNALRLEMSAAGVACAGLWARVLPEGRYNDLVRVTRNKSAVSFSLVAALMERMLTECQSRGVPGLIVCDRQGGRERYGEVLRTSFPDWHLTVETETPGRAEYSLTAAPSRPGKPRPQQQQALGTAGTLTAPTLTAPTLTGPTFTTVRIIFCEKGEQEALPTALASMLAKYLREALMHRFNRWWTTRQPGLTPTAGYYTDAIRFLEDTADLRGSLSVADAELIRER